MPFSHRLVGGARAQAQFTRPPFLCAVERIAPVSSTFNQGNLNADLLVIGLSHNQLCNRIPLGRLGKAEEVADAAAFLAQNSYANNCVLTIDGGLSSGFFA